MGKFNLKFLHSFCERPLSKEEILPRAPLFRDLVTLKIVSKLSMTWMLCSVHHLGIFFAVSNEGCKKKKSATNRTEVLMRLLEQSSDLVSISQISKQKFIFS